MYKISSFNKSRKYMHLMGKMISILLYILIIPIIIFNLTLIVKSCITPDETPDFFGFKSFVIVSESMEPTIMTGDAIFVKEVEQKELKVNDIISFQDGISVNTHRIINIKQDNGITQYTTKGDNNKKEDRQKVTYDKIEGKYQFKINGFGKIIETLKNKITLVILLILLVLVSIYQMRLVKRKLMRKEKRYEYNKLSFKNSEDGESQKMNKIRNTKGITLISLVVTIIILLILAGVTIATLTGENGILTQANTTKEKTERAEIIERAKIDILEEQVGNNGQIAQKDVNTIIANYDKEKKIREDKDEAYIITEKGYEIKVSEIWKSIGKILAKDVLKTDATATEEAAKSPYVKYNGLDCRVLYNDETHGIQIITSESVENVTLGYNDTMVTASDFSYDGTVTINNSFKKAAASYNNVVENLNKRAKTYMDSEGIAIDICTEITFAM